jgi:hypothetical protein
MEYHAPTLMDSRPSLANEPSVYALHEAMKRQLAEDAPATAACSPELTRAIRALCATAREKGLRAEEVVLLFKSTWASMPAANTKLVGQQRTDLLDRAVTLCIKSYYSAD